LLGVSPAIKNGIKNVDIKMIENTPRFDLKRPLLFTVIFRSSQRISLIF
jgi:hypothetical protein